MRTRIWFSGLVVLLLAAATLPAKKKNPDDVTQTLALPKEPPSVVTAEAGRLLFHVSPLSGKGLLSQQTRDALRAILKMNGGLPVVHLRAFVAGSGDVRRVPQIVSEVFSDKKMPLPSISVVLAGGLPLDNAQVVLEAVSMAKRDISNSGVEFVTTGDATAPDPSSPSAPLLDKTLSGLAAKIGPSNAIQVSCFVSAMNNPAALTASIAARFPSAAVNLVQTQRAPVHALASCEAVVRGGAAPSEKLAFTGTRVAFGTQEKDAALAFQRLDRDLAEAGAAPSDIVFTNIYSLSQRTAGAIKKLRPSTAPTAVIPFEGLASIDAGFAVDAVATVSR